jgi:hypothetical protein
MKNKKESLKEIVRRVIKEESDIDRLSNNNSDIDNRLKKYIKDKEPNVSFRQYKDSFMDDADPTNSKSPQDAYSAYFKIVNAFLKKQGY